MIAPYRRRGMGTHSGLDLWDVGSWKLLGPLKEIYWESKPASRPVDKDRRWHVGPINWGDGGGNDVCRIRTVPGRGPILFPSYQRPPVWMVVLLDKSVILESDSTGAELHRFPEYQDKSWREVKMRLSPDCRSLIGLGEREGSARSEVFIWDVSGLIPKPPTAPILSPRDLEAAWAEMAGIANRACPAMRRLAADPRRAVPFLEARLRRADLVDAPKWLGDLGSADFETRERAEQQLVSLDVAALPLLRKAQRKFESAEVSGRLTRIVRLLDKAAESDDLRLYRAIDVLEQVGTRPAREVLGRLAGGARGKDAATFAKQAMGRMEKRDAPKKP